MNCIVSNNKWLQYRACACDDFLSRFQWSYVIMTGKCIVSPRVNSYVCLKF